MSAHYIQTGVKGRSLSYVYSSFIVAVATLSVQGAELRVGSLYTCMGLRY